MLAVYSNFVHCSPARDGLHWMDLKADLLEAPIPPLSL